MKKWTWKQWTAFGLVVAAVVALVVLHLVQPTVSYALCEAFVALAFVLGGVAGYLLKDKGIIKNTEE